MEESKTRAAPEELVPVATKRLKTTETSKVVEAAPKMSTTSDKLKAAAEELVKAAYLDTNAEANKETIEAIHLGTDSLKTLDTHLVAWKSSMDDKANTVHQNMDNLKDALAKVDDKLSELKRSQLLAAGIQNCTYNSFNYIDHGGNQKASESLVRSILFHFQKGMGSNLPSSARMDCYVDGCGEALRLSQQAFRDKLVEQIYELTGVKPRIVEPKKDGGPYQLFQS
jgi:hypothetical protein